MNQFKHTFSLLLVLMLIAAIIPSASAVDADEPNNISVRTDHFYELTEPLTDYDEIKVRPGNGQALVIDRPLVVNNLSVIGSSYYSEETNQDLCEVCRIVITNDGSMTANDSIGTNSSSVTVEKGGKLSSPSYLITENYYNYTDTIFPNALTVHEGAVFECDTLTISKGTTAQFCGDVTVSEIINNGTLLLCGSSDGLNISGIGEVVTGHVCVYCQTGFTDVDDGAWFAAPIVWAVNENITTGVSNSLFDPNGLCNRAQVVTFLWRAAGSPAPKSEGNPFVDVQGGQFYTDAVLWAVEQGITTGVDETHFDPNGICNRAQVVTFLWRAANKPAPTSKTNPFTDVKKNGNAAWYYDAVLWAVENKITTGLTQTTFAPNDNCNRAQIVTFLYRNAG